MNNFLNLLSVTVLIADSLNACTSPVVDIPGLGSVEGYISPKYLWNQEYEIFEGVPFAEPPIGNLRFSSPQPVKPWGGLYNATYPRDACIQKDLLQASQPRRGSEDCLYLNIYRPIRSTETPLPVIVFIHGGAFSFGYISPEVFSPDYIMETKEVILVLAAYRLGPFGFLSTGDENMPGNFAFKDQVMTLKWVQKYIKAFGGDPNCVTIMGQSAGGASVHLHMLSEQSKGLFHRAFAMSGNAGAPYATPLSDPLGQARQQAVFCNISNAATMSTKELTAALRKVDAVTLLDASGLFKYWHMDPLTTFRLTVERPSPEAFISVHPDKLIVQGKYNLVPFMTGTVENEGAVRSVSILTNETLIEEFNERFDYLLTRMMEFPPHVQNVPIKLDQVLDHYCNGTHQLNEHTSQGFTNIITDRAFIHPLYKTVYSYVSKIDIKKYPLYLYRFRYRGEYSYSYIMTFSNIDFGVIHCDDLIYTLPPTVFMVPMNSTSGKLAKIMVQNLVSFAKTGKPRYADNAKECTLKSFSENKFCDYLDIKNTDNGFSILPSNVFDTDAVQLWDDVLK